MVLPAGLGIKPIMRPIPEGRHPGQPSRRPCVGALGAALKSGAQGLYVSSDPPRGHQPGPHPRDKERGAARSRSHLLCHAALRDFDAPDGFLASANCSSSSPLRTAVIKVSMTDGITSGGANQLVTLRPARSAALIFPPGDVLSEMVCVDFFWIGHMRKRHGVSLRWPWAKRP